MTILKRPPMDADTIAEFPKGARVRATGGAMCGMLGTVHHAVKSRGVICVEFDEHGCLFDARPERLERLAVATTPDTIDMTPTWAGIMPGLIASLTHGTPIGQKIASEELMRLARLVDAANKENRA